jgi:hypothetical protein
MSVIAIQIILIKYIFVKYHQQLKPTTMHLHHIHHQTISLNKSLTQSLNYNTHNLAQL